MSLHPTSSSSSPLLQGQRPLPGLHQGLNLGPTVCLLEGTLSSTRDRERANIIKIIVKKRNGQKVGTLRPKLKFYLFQPEKRPYSKKFISIFSQEYIFFLISLQLDKIVQCKQCYPSKLFVYLILLPIVGNFISIFSQEYIYFFNFIAT